MNKIVFGVFAVVLCLSCVAGAQDGSSEPAKDGPGAKLRADLIKAVQNGHLTDEQKTSMQNAAAALREAGKARQSGQKVDRDAVKKAFSEIKKVVNSDAFQPQDKQAVQADLEAVKEKVKESRGGRRRGPLRQILGGGI